MRKTYYISKNLNSKLYSIEHVHVHDNFLSIRSFWDDPGIRTGHLIESNEENKDWILLETLKGNIIDKFEMDDILLESPSQYNYTDKVYLYRNEKKKFVAKTIP